MKFTKLNEPTNLGAIRAWEESLGLSLPQSYTNFLLHYNGGYPDPENDYFEVPGWNGLIVQEFLGLVSSADMSLMSKHFSNFSRHIDRQMLFIAYDPYAQQVTMDLRPTTYGRIYIRSHVYPPQGPLQIDDTGFTPDDYEEAQLFVPVAESFEAFIAALGPVPE